LAGAKERATRLHAHLVALEHRYYGKSMPVPDQSPANMKYLSTGQALADLADFIKSMRQTSDLTGPWIIEGGSYPGSLAAYFRALYPDLVVGALASSAPVKAQVDFPEFDEHEARALGVDCAKNVRRLINAFDSAVANDPVELAKIKTTFGLSADASNDEMAQTLDVGDFIDEGHIDTLCTAVKTSNIDQAFSALSSLLAAMQENAPSDQATSATEAQNGLSWLWQLCTEYGYFQRASSNRDLSVKSSLLTLDSMTYDCRAAFGVSGLGQADATNAQYYARLAQATRVLYVNGSNDPWSELSIVADTPDALQRDVHTIVIPGTAHVWDLFPSSATDLPALQTARDATDKILLRWLTSPGN
jgi:pimeloyl-ACP methyl ester carboxylesterase